MQIHAMLPSRAFSKRFCKPLHTQAYISFPVAALILLIPTCVGFSIEAVGRLYATDVLLLVALLPLFLVRGRVLLNREPRMVLILAGLWLVSLVLTDLMRQTPFQDYSRGWARVSLFMVDFAALYLLLANKRRRLQLFVAGTILGQLLAYVLVPSEEALDVPWKFGYGPTVTLLIMLLACNQRIRRLPTLQAIAITFTGLLNLVMGSRGTAAICLLVAAYVFLGHLYRRSPRRQKLRIDRSFWPLVLVACGGLFGASAFYEHAAQSGWLGEEARDKYEAQSSGDYGVLLGGRSEILAAMQAVIDSPVLGHGSWAKDPTYVDIAIERLVALGYPAPVLNDILDELIPSHSYLFGAWVEAGVAGAVCWAWIFALAVRGLRTAYKQNEPLIPVIAFASFELLWSILFSPFGATGRFYAAFAVCLLIYVLAYDPQRVAIRQARAQGGSIAPYESSGR